MDAAEGGNLDSDGGTLLEISRAVEQILEEREKARVLKKCRRRRRWNGWNEIFIVFALGGVMENCCAASTGHEGWFEPCSEDWFEKAIMTGADFGAKGYITPKLGGMC